MDDPNVRAVRNMNMAERRKQRQERAKEKKFVSLPPDDERVMNELREVSANSLQRRSKPDVATFVRDVIQLRESKTFPSADNPSITIQERYDFPFRFQENYLCSNKIYDMNGNKYRIQSFLLSEHIFHNVLPYELRARLPLPAYFTYLLNNNGLHLGWIRNSFEFGACHYKLGVDPETVRSSNRMEFALDGMKTVIIAGEMKLDENDIWFNFESGTFTKEMKLPNFPKYQEYLISTLTTIFGYTPPDEKPFRSVQFVEGVLLPKDVFPTLGEIHQECSDPRNQLEVKYAGSEEFVNFCEEARLTNLDKVRAYFERNPYEYVRVSFDEGLTTYHNPEPVHPARFEVIDVGSKKRKEMAFGKARRSNPRRRVSKNKKKSISKRRVSKDKKKSISKRRVSKNREKKK